LLTVGYRELEQAVERLQGEAKQLQASLRKAQGQLLEIEAGQLADGAPVVGEVRVVRRVWEGREPGELRALAQEVARLPGMVALLASIGERVNLCFARSEDVGLDVGVWLRDTCASLGGKGGGRPHLAQGSAPVAEASRVEALLGTLSSTVETGEPSIRYPPLGTKDPGL
jgi:alanyl-tRNA synthetase